jgi:hypothetical protein
MMAAAARRLKTSGVVAPIVSATPLPAKAGIPGEVFKNAARFGKKRRRSRCSASTALRLTLSSISCSSGRRSRGTRTAAVADPATLSPPHAPQSMRERAK